MRITSVPFEKYRFGAPGPAVPGMGSLPLHRGASECKCVLGIFSASCIRILLPFLEVWEGHACDRGRAFSYA